MIHIYQWFLICGPRRLLYESQNASKWEQSFAFCGIIYCEFSFVSREKKIFIHQNHFCCAVESNVGILIFPILQTYVETSLLECQVKLRYFTLILFVFLFKYTLLNNASISSEYVDLNGSVISELLTMRDVKKVSWPI